MLGSFRASVMPLYACGKMKSLSPDFSELISVSVSAFGTMTTFAAFGVRDESQNLSFGTRMAWSALHESSFHSRPEKGSESWKSAETSLQSWTLLASKRLANRFLYGA